MTLHIAQYSNIIADLRDEIRRLRQKVDQHQPTSPQKHGTTTGNMTDVIHTVATACQTTEEMPASDLM